jgi:hypothetical protein
MKARIIAALLRLYPTAWVQEYGPELEDMLRTKPMTAGVIVDVIGSALGQRIRSTDLATRAGFAMLLVTLTAVAWNVVAPPPYEPQTNAKIPTLAEPVQILQQPLNSELYVLMLVAFSAWFRLRRGGSLAAAGRAAMKASFIAGLPMIVVGILILSGALNLVTLAPGDIPTSFTDHGFTLTYYTTRNVLPAPYVLLFSPLFRLPGSFIWGLVGGEIGRWIAQARRPAVGS